MRPPPQAGSQTPDFRSARRPTQGGSARRGICPARAGRPWRRPEMVEAVGRHPAPRHEGGRAGGHGSQAASPLDSCEQKLHDPRMKWPRLKWKLPEWGLLRDRSGWLLLFLLLVGTVGILEI